MLINIAWKQSFARIGMNKKAIADRGWGPYNRSMLTLSRIRVIMTETEKLNDVHYEVVLSPSSSIETIKNDYSIFDNMLSSNSRYSDSNDINLIVGIAASVTDTIVQHEDILITRERINNKQNNRKTI